VSETVTSDDDEVGGTPHRAKMRGRGIVQALEWEVLPKDQAYRVGLGNRVLSGELQNARELAVLRVRRRSRQEDNRHWRRLSCSQAVGKRSHQCS
jgi:hypothetical protein